MNRVFTALAAAATIVAAVPAYAGSILHVAARAGNYTSDSTSLIGVPLDLAGDTEVFFTTTKSNTVVRVVYNAECGVLGPAESRVTIVVMVDGNPTYPDSDTHFAFCTATSTRAYVWTGATREAYYKVPTPGSHKLQIFAAELGGATEWWLGDSFTSVDD